MKLTKKEMMRRLVTGMVQGRAFRENSIPGERLVRKIKIY